MVTVAITAAARGRVARRRQRRRLVAVAVLAAVAFLAFLKGQWDETRRKEEEAAAIRRFYVTEYDRAVKANQEKQQWDAEHEGEPTPAPFPDTLDTWKD